MGGTRSSGTVGAGVGGAPVVVVPPPSTEPVRAPRFDHQNVEVLERLSEKAQSEKTLAIFNDLKKEIAKEGIPAPKKHASRMVSGYSSVTASGVSVTFGRSYEKEGVQMAELRQASKAAVRSNRTVTKLWRHPTEIFVEGLSSGMNASSPQVDAWVSRIGGIASKLGLRVEQDGSNRLTLKL